MSAAISLYVHVEEPSMQAALVKLLPRLLGGADVFWQVIDHGSKQALLRNIGRRMQAYRKIAGDNRVLALVDRDDDDCRVLKQRLEGCAQAGMATKTSPGPDGRFRVVNRIVVEELEAWFFGDVAALQSAYPGVSATLAAKAAFRDPDAIAGGTWEALLRVLQTAKHYPGSTQLPKTEVARRVAEHMSLERNRSRSCQAFVAGLKALLV